MKGVCRQTGAKGAELCICQPSISSPCINKAYLAKAHQAVKAARPALLRQRLLNRLHGALPALVAPAPLGIAVGVPPAYNRQTGGGCRDVHSHRSTAEHSAAANAEEEEQHTTAQLCSSSWCMRYTCAIDAHAREQLLHERQRTTRSRGR